MKDFFQKPVMFSGSRNEDTSADIRHNLALARELRVALSLDFMQGDDLAHQTQGFIQELTPTLLTLHLWEAPRQVLDTDTEVGAYFSLPVDQQKTPFHFSTTLAYPVRNGENHRATLKFPKHMDHTQRRGSYRLHLNSTALENFRIWYGQMEQKANELPKPTWLPVESKCVAIEDISVGGARIKISRDSPVTPLLKKKGTLLMSATFPSKNKAPMKLLMAADVVRMESGEKTPNTTLGLCFKHWTTLDPHGLHWVNVNKEDGIAPLGKWIVQADIAHGKLV